MTDLTDVERAVEVIKAGRPAILPTDTVYGLCVTAFDPTAFDQLNAIKGRSEQPVALLAASVEQVLDAVPELRGGAAERALRELLPGPYTFVLPNPERRLAWLTPTGAATIGVRIPVLSREAREVIERAGAVAATSANLHGEPDPRRLGDLTAAVRDAAAGEIDGGELPGAPSTVVSLVGVPAILREGAVPAAEALERVRAALESGDQAR